MSVRRAVVLDIVEQTVGNFDDSLVRNVLVRPVEQHGSAAERPAAGKTGQPHCMPNLMPRKRFGSLSTSCGLTGVSTECAMALVDSRNLRRSSDEGGAWIPQDAESCQDRRREP